MLRTNSLSAERIIVPHPYYMGHWILRSHLNKKHPMHLMAFVLRYGEHFLTRVPSGTINY